MSLPLTTLAKPHACPTFKFNKSHQCMEDTSGVNRNSHFMKSRTHFFNKRWVTAEGAVPKHHSNVCFAGNMNRSNYISRSPNKRVCCCLVVLLSEIAEDGRMEKLAIYTVTEGWYRLWCILTGVDWKMFQHVLNDIFVNIMRWVFLGWDVMTFLGNCPELKNIPSNTCNAPSLALSI